MRSKLFVPGSRPELFDKAMAGDADALSFDLQDAVDESQKHAARTAVSAFLSALPRQKSKIIIVRVNAVTSRHFEADVEALRGTAIDMINIPLIESAEDLREAARITSEIPILANIETAKGLRLAHEIAVAHPALVGLQLGFGDMLEPLGIDRCNAAVVLQIQLAMRLAAGEAGVFAYDSAYTDIDDNEGLRREAEGARKLGYLGKSAIHPRQVPIINSAFRPDADQIAHALKVVQTAGAAKASGVGAWTVDGKMVDAPFVTRARDTLALAGRLGLL